MFQFSGNRDHAKLIHHCAIFKLELRGFARLLLAKSFRLLRSGCRASSVPAAFSCALRPKLNLRYGNSEIPNWDGGERRRRKYQN